MTYIANGSPTGPQTQFSTFNTSGTLEYWTDPSLTQTATYTTPSVAINTSNSTLTAGTVQWAPGQASFHPGQNGEIAYYSFIAPITAVYALNASFGGLDFVGPTNTNVQILLDGVSLFLGNVGGFGAGPSFASNTLSMTAGDQLLFEVSFNVPNPRGSGPFYYDTTGISATLVTAVPEPSTWAMIILGFAGMGFMTYHRRAKPALMAA
ncbi:MULTISPECIES: PEP-CTERM sorting domain-containing protein [Bradyrhizobium]|uniref:PEP-CTERM protein-sorting domain-containing protein n=2 Tax=Bradyrhizobium TaxID=374 RepID=A0ABY0Q7C7_9BRAD|nr:MULTISPECIES: PEP-CTERM sorting domain-containing protein [Bradyrhizobium]SDJ63069.1 PEP-CTERM protein-sorting domain-containing protein [Bradyrhizobium ottawaense]SEC33930.1 PEP-CTERM protein-sorting domain-containing protein [Bradyrhizobium lablabi]